jgi:hypothetical protein
MYGSNMLERNLQEGNFNILRRKFWFEESGSTDDVPAKLEKLFR